jgi:membrane protein required for colicin V production
MNWLDLIILIPLVGGLFSGYKNGLIGEVASLAALIFGIWGAVKFSGWTANLLDTWGVESQYMHIISFVITFIIIVVVIQIIAKMLRELVNALALGWIDRIAGIGLGMIKAILITSVLLFVIDYIDQRKNFVPKDAKQESLLFRPMADLIPNLLPFLNIENIEKELDQIKNKDNDTGII